MAGFSTVSALLILVCALMMLPARIEGRFVMPWICADSDPCGNDKGAVDAQIKQLGAGVCGWLSPHILLCCSFTIATTTTTPPLHVLQLLFLKRRLIVIRSRHH